MKKLTNVGEEVRASEGRVYDPPPVVGLAALVGRGLRRLARPDARRPEASPAAGVERVRETGSGHRRSTMEAGITGGISLLLDGSGDRRRRG